MGTVYLHIIRIISFTNQPTNKIWVKMDKQTVIISVIRSCVVIIEILWHDRPDKSRVDWWDHVLWRRYVVLLLLGLLENKNVCKSNYFACVQNFS